MGVTVAMYSQGYCLNEECEEFSKGVFLQGQRTDYTCHRCKEQGVAEIEKHWPASHDSLNFSQVRLEFNFCAVESRYRGLCVVTDESRPPANIWYARTPNIKTEKQANKTATDVLAFLQRADEKVFEPNIIIRNSEILLTFDIPMANLKVELDNLEHTLGRSRLAWH